MVVYNRIFELGNDGEPEGYTQWKSHASWCGDDSVWCSAELVAPEGHLFKSCYENLIKHI